MEAESGRDMASVLLANGEGFLPPPDMIDSGDAHEICYMRAIAAELALKAFLVSQGWSDNRCRQEIRHDLQKGLASARAAGLCGAADELADVIEVLNAYYPHHTFDRFVLPAGDPRFVPRARFAVGDLIDIVRPYVEASGGR